MTDATPNSLWKSFCRFMEHKAFVRRFGDGYGRRFDSFAIFEVSAAQHEAMKDAVFSEGEVAPPFPFPKIVIIFSDFVLTLEQPQMDLDTGMLEYEASVYYVRNNDHEEVAFAKVKLDVDGSVAAHEVLAEIAEFRMQAHYPDEIIDYDGDVSFSSKIERNTERLRRSNDPKVIAELDLILAETRRVESDLYRVLRDHLRTCFIMGILTIAWINRPKHYIVERAPEIERKPSKADRNRVRRLAERSRNIIIDHDEIRRRWTNCHGTHGSPMPHLRRGHYKTLRSERYKNMRGKVIWVSPCHVGGECVEWREGAVSYKVVG